ncbi:MAG: cytochrome c3 family protein [Planctomycetota bacterium]|jgi:hypothetical protein
MALKDVQHVLRMAQILLAVAAAALIVRAQFVPPTFGQYGTYRGKSIPEIMERPEKYHGVDNCKNCHTHHEQWKEWQGSVHKSVACETCHGPFMEHSKLDIDPRPVFGTKELMAKSHDLCLSCHAKTPGRPAGFPQVVFEKHITRYNIAEKYAAADPLIATDGSAVSTRAEESAPPAVEDAPPAAEDATTEPLPEEYSCKLCHGKEGMLADDEETRHLIVTEEHMTGDVHWQKGLRCHDCHGGNPNLDEYEDHRSDESFRSPGSPGEIPEFCGHCHSNIEYMSRYAPSPRTDQVTKYWASSHGARLNDHPDDAGVATCVSCHGHHGIRTVNDPQSPAYPTNLTKTCGSCHFDVESMRGYGHSPLASGHGQRLEEDGALEVATCVTCHGYHTIRAIADLGSPYHCVACHKGHVPARRKRSSELAGE